MASPIVLEIAPMVSVRVSAADGRPAAGASVHQRPQLSTRHGADLSAQERERAFALWRETPTDDEGGALLAALSGPQLVDAVRGELRSKPWAGSPPEQVELQLVACFTLVGRVEPEDPRADLAQCRVDVHSRSNAVRWLTGSLPVRADGSLGPALVPAVPAEACEFELQGGAVVASTLERPTPAPGERVEVVLFAKRGARFPVLVRDESATPLFGARVSWAWQAGERWQWVDETSDETGLAVLRAGPLGPIWLDVIRKGFVPDKQALSLWSDVSPPYPVTLKRGGILQGRVTTAAGPARDFTIVWRRSAQTGELTPFDVRDSKDGRYSIEGVPLGEILAFAVSDDLPRTAGARGAVRADQPAVLDFVLRPGAKAQAHVLDAQSGEPVPDARAQMWITDQRVRLRRFGPLAAPDPSGRIELGGVSAGESNCVEVIADGYARFLQVFQGGAGGDVDLGVLALTRPRSIIVELLADEGTDPSAYSVSADGADSGSPVPFPPDRSVRIAGLVAGGYRVTLEKGIEWSCWKSCTLTPQADASVRFDVRKRHALDVEVVPTASAPLPDGCVVRTRSFSKAGHADATWQVPIPASRSVDLGDAPGPMLVVEALTGAGKTLGSLVVPDVARAERHLVLTLGQPARRLRLIDRDRNPIPGLSVTVGLRPGGWSRAANTDARGEIELEALPGTQVDLGIDRAPLGGGVLLGVDLTGDPTEVVFDPHCGLAVRVLDGTVPLAGVDLWLQDGSGLGFGFETLHTDSTGLARREGFLDQSFRIEAQHPGLWPATATLRATDPPAPATIQVRRRGSVILHAKRGGLAVTDLSIEVASEEFSTSVSEWVAAKQVTNTPATSRTDAQGRLRLDGLPHGSYRWEVATQDGSPVVGRFEVEPARRVDVDLLLP